MLFNYDRSRCWLQPISLTMMCGGVVKGIHRQWQSTMVGSGRPTWPWWSEGRENLEGIMWECR